MATPKPDPEWFAFEWWLVERGYSKATRRTYQAGAHNYLEFLKECEEWPPEMTRALEACIIKTMESWGM